MKKSINDPFVKEELTGDVKPKRSRLPFYSFILNLFLLLILGLMLSNGGVRFALLHNPEATRYAGEYQKVEQLAKQASSDVLKEWANSNRVR